MEDAEATKKHVDAMTASAASPRAPTRPASSGASPAQLLRLKEEARKLLAWEEIQSEEDIHRLDDTQRFKLKESLAAAQRHIKEAVWQAYNTIALLGKDNQLKVMESWPDSLLIVRIATRPDSLEPDCNR